MNLNPDILKRCRELHLQGATMEELVAMLRESGCMPLESIVTMREVTGMSLRESKAAVHLSETWADMREQFDRFHDRVIEAMEILGHKEGSTVKIEEADESGGTENSDIASNSKE